MLRFRFLPASDDRQMLILKEIIRGRKSKNAWWEGGVRVSRLETLRVSSSSSPQSFPCRFVRPKSWFGSALTSSYSLILLLREDVCFNSVTSSGLLRLFPSVNNRRKGNSEILSRHALDRLLFFTTQQHEEKKKEKTWNELIVIQKKKKILFPPIDLYSLCSKLITTRQKENRQGISPTNGISILANCWVRKKQVS